MEDFENMGGKDTLSYFLRSSSLTTLRNVLIDFAGDHSEGNVGLISG
ncbi:MAG: hypothetical protein SVY15_00340 [Halobacteriota archaeon]|nr:hypothetical protein [Halobacteriota archaeon]